MTERNLPGEPLGGAELATQLEHRVTWNLPISELVAEAVRRGEGELTRAGALSVRTGEFTGRSPSDRYLVRRPPLDTEIDWSSRFNQTLPTAQAEALVQRFAQAAAAMPRLYGFRGSVGRGRHRLSIAVITELAWHALMARHMFVRTEETGPPDFTLLYTPSTEAIPSVDGTRSPTVILADLDRQLAVLGGTSYGGEQKKLFFSLMNERLPHTGDLPMHCAANVGVAGDVCLLFGLSGTGKTTLSADPERRLLGDDEHGWDSDGVFNFEGGCYAKLIRLSEAGEPLIWNAVHQPGALLENVPVHDGVPDFADDAVENTRGVYPLEALNSVEPSGCAGHATTVVFLTYDASGTLPPLAILNEEQALFWFLAGYTAKVAGTERGTGKRPEPTFSACFGAPFLPRHPRVYLELLRRRLREHRPTVVLMNTGCVGAPAEAGGSRTPLGVTRNLLRLAQNGELAQATCKPHPVFGFQVPIACGSIAPELLDPQLAWAAGATDYLGACRELAGAFRSEVVEKYRGSVAPEVLAAAPG